jgi:hypothetical protein
MTEDRGQRTDRREKTEKTEDRGQTEERRQRRQRTEDRRGLSAKPSLAVCHLLSDFCVLSSVL